jgi:sorting nexin-25
MRLNEIKKQLESIEQQEALLDMMIQRTLEEKSDKRRQAEMKILNKMKAQYLQERQVLSSEKLQLEFQGGNNVLVCEETTLTISSWTLGSSPKNSKQFVVYIVEVKQRSRSNENVEPEYLSGWIIARRYSEFDELHRRLKAKYPAIMSQYELPTKRYFHASRLRSRPSSASFIPDSPFDLLDRREREFMEERRSALQAYLRSLTSGKVWR